MTAGEPSPGPTGAAGVVIVVRPPSAVAAVTTPRVPTAITARTSRMRRIVERSPLYRPAPRRTFRPFPGCFRRYGRRSEHASHQHRLGPQRDAERRLHAGLDLPSEN